MSDERYRRFEIRFTHAQHALFEACRAYENDKALAGWMIRSLIKRARELTHQGKIPPALLGKVVREESGGE